VRESGKIAIEDSRWRSAELLERPEEIATYLEAPFGDGDPAVITYAPGVAARAKSISQVARESGLSCETLSKVLTPEGEPKLPTLFGVLKALGMKVPRARHETCRRAPCRQLGNSGFIAFTAQILADNA
jgi:probable addiction module antidote protein